MDIFVEHMVKRKRAPSDIIISVAAVFIGIVLIVFVVLPITLMYPIMQAFAGILPAAIIYGIYRLIASRDIEYEYILTNGEMDIDMIISRRRRKRLTSVSCRAFEIVAPLMSDKYKEEYKNLKTVFAARAKNSSSAYFGVYNGKNGRECLVFEPSKKILDAVRLYAREKVFINEN